MHWPTARLGLVAAVTLGVLWLLVPVRGPAAEGVAADAMDCLQGSLAQDDPAMLTRCRDLLRAGLHRDLLGRHLPGLLRVVEALSLVDRRCSPRQGDAFQRGLCALAQRRPDEALRLWGEVPPERGGAAYREVAAGLLRRQRGSPSGGRAAP